MTQPRYVKGVTGAELFFRRCECGELNVYGFWQQLTHNVEGNRVVVPMPCRKCGHVHSRTFRLTTASRIRPRLMRLEWFCWWLLTANWIPWTWRRNVAIFLTKLDMRFPL